MYPTTKSAFEGPQSTAPATKSAHQDTSRSPVPFARDFLRFLKASHMSKSHDSLHLPRNQTTMSKVLCLPRNLYIDRHKATPISCEKLILGHQNSRFLMCLSRKAITKPENVHGTTTRTQSRRAPVPAHQILHFEDLEVNACSGNSSELAGRPDEHQSLKSLL